MTADATPSAPAVVAPGGVLGVLGGGQLGRMIALAAARLGLRTHVYAPMGEHPAAQVAAEATRGSDDYHLNLAAFAKACDVVTYEFENVPVSAVERAARTAPVRPGRRALEVAQDRLVEKRFLRSIGCPTTEFHDIDGLASLNRALLATGGRGVLKTRRMGYDGRGQARVAARGPADVENVAREAFAAIDRAPAILEAEARFVREISVIAARGLDGAIAAYDPAENLHRDGILRESRVPGAISPSVAAEAVRMTTLLLEGLDYIGVIGVEFFEMPDGRLLVNEFAPRVHNSGHWTLEACVVSQFEQHVRAVCGWPLGDPTRHSDATMTNLIGDDAADWAALAAEPGAALHLYGKAEARPGRKMGHVTRIAPRGA